MVLHYKKIVFNYFQSCKLNMITNFFNLTHLFLFVINSKPFRRLVSQCLLWCC